MNKAYVIIGLIVLAAGLAVNFVYTDYANIPLMQNTTEAGEYTLMMPLWIVLPLAGALLTGIGIMKKK